MKTYQTSFLLYLLLNGPLAWSSNGCVDVTLGTVQLSVPQQHMTSPLPRKDNSGNFIFAFDSSIPGIDCPLACKELFVNISSVVPTPEKNWEFLAPKFTGRTSHGYRIYLDRFIYPPKPSREILVPSDMARPQDEFYWCDLESERQDVTPLCSTKVVAKNGLIAQFSIPRKVLGRAREATKFVTQSIDQFSENHSKGICK